MKDTYRERIKEEQKKLSPQQVFFSEGYQRLFQHLADEVAGEKLEQLLERLRQRFARFHFAAGEFPAVFVFAVAALCGKNFAVLDNDGGNDFNGLHCVGVLSIMGSKYTC